MGIGPVEPIVPAVGQAQEWQQLGWMATNQAIEHFLRGCADVAMARTPQQSLAALHETQTSLLRHSRDTLAEIARLWHQQNADLLGIGAERASGSERPPTKSGTMRLR
jgi:hypothetical protein